MEKIDTLQEISKFIFTGKYAKYNEKEKRRETWEETINRGLQMHLNHYNFLNNEDKKEINWAFDIVKSKLAVPSMRSLQFGGKAVEAHHARMYNCSVRHIDSIRSFSEVFYLLLCGCGVGLGLSKFFLARLPNLVNAKDKTGTVITYQIEDNIEGWADSIEALLNCYFKNTAYSGRKIVFDYSKIRPAGTPLKTGGGKAPGYKGLKFAHEQIKGLFDYIIEELGQDKLKPINAYDIIMHTADATLSGGVRRSSCSVIFDKDDEDFINAKINYNVTKYAHFEQNPKTKNWEGIVYVDGQYGGRKHKKYEVELDDFEFNQLKDKKKIYWKHIEPQRARSNNSVLLLRQSTTLEEFTNIIKRSREWGEPGYVFADHPWTLFNPCITGDALVDTNKGKIRLDELVERFKNGEPFEILSINEKTMELSYQKLENAAKTRENAEIIELELEDGELLKCTPDHKIYVENKGWTEAKDLTENDVVIKV